MKLKKKIKKLGKLIIKLKDCSSNAFINRQPVAPIITGILKRFEYLTANFLWNPRKRIAIITDPDLLTPGIKAKD